ncbi:hypothetical protein BSL82_03405 [Tardibacter chloracetimidivorans]|uniref:Uncharacterized protein n=1 Tax=Tardibacter chloracetimidivorans TaxID=1921510 RepID=A0A1L3ZS64_9SPHN|nr:hypothetical protein [Tardibacter chloracetimidivorans]API58464.1 hypothetical protein BSL82_03405 [Tardibacter chloracetimidivorans]
MAGILDLIGKGLSGVGILGGGDKDPISPEDRRLNNGFSGASTFANDRVGQKLTGTEQKSGLFNRPGASEALIAFGANMLAAPSFGQGMGAGASAFLDTLREEEDRRKPKTQFLADGAIQASVDPMTGKVSYAPVEAVQDWQSGLANQKLEGQQALLDARGDQRMDQILAQGAMANERAAMQQSAAMERAMMAQSGAMERAYLAAASRGNQPSFFEKSVEKADAKQFEKGYDNFLAASDALPVYRQLRQEYGKAGVGAGVVQGGVRQVAQAFGMDVGDVDLTSKNFAEALLSKIELGAAQSQRGLGQLTEMERAIIRRSIPNMATDPKAFNKVLGVLEANAIRTTRMFNSYVNKAQKDPGTSYIRYTTNWKDNYEKAFEKQVTGGGKSKGVAKITSDAQFNSLPSGATFIGPDGKIRKKP